MLKQHRCLIVYHVFYIVRQCRYHLALANPPRFFAILPAGSTAFAVGNTH
jgi:hypothetical protein